MRLYVAVACSLLVLLDGFLIALIYSESLFIHKAQPKLRIGKILVGRLLIPSQRLFVVLVDAVAEEDVYKRQSSA